MTNQRDYMNHITTEYDKKFVACPDLKWDPWVGKNYTKTGILIMVKVPTMEMGSGGKNTARIIETQAAD